MQWLLPSPASETTQSLGHTNKGSASLSLLSFRKCRGHEQGFKAKPNPLLLRLSCRRSLYRFQDWISSRAHLFCLCAQMFWDVSHFREAVRQACALVVHYLSGRGQGVSESCRIYGVTLYYDGDHWGQEHGSGVPWARRHPPLSRTASVHKSTLSAAI